MTECPLIITFLLVIRNEVEHVRECLESMLNQTLAPERYEIVVVDGMSTDGTRDAIERFIADHPAKSIRMLDNPNRILSSGWNIGVRQGRGQYVIRPDAHAEVPEDFLERSLDVMNMHPEAWVVGGALETRGKGFWGESIASGLSCRMGVGASSFRVGGPPGPAVTVVFGLYRREKLLEIGGFDETIALNQDNVCHARIREAGGLLYFDPSIRSTYYCRSSLSTLWGQMFRRSIWLMLMLKHQTAGSLQLRYLVPLFFVLTLLVASVAGIFWWPARAIGGGVCGLYLLAGWSFAFRMRSLSLTQKLLLPLVFLVTHVAYGLGSIVGLVRLMWYKPKIIGT